MYGSICESCKWYRKEQGRCSLPEEELADLLENGYSSDTSCSKYKRDESKPGDEKVKERSLRKEMLAAQREDLARLVHSIQVGHEDYYDRLDEQRRESRERED